jgi:ABC-type multidrug transport system fused ATPase/permease subunit
MTVVMLQMDAAMTAVALAIVPVLFFAIVALSARINALASDARVKESALWAVAQRTIGAIRVIQAFTTEQAEYRRFLGTSTASLDANLRLYTFQSVYSAFVNVLIAGRHRGRPLVRRDAPRRRAHPGDLLDLHELPASLYAPINSLTQTWGMIQGARRRRARVRSSTRRPTSSTARASWRRRREGR